MGIAERKNREKEERRQLILEKSKALILEHGVPSLSMQDIADAAELSKATLYLYFESKEALLVEILNESSDSFVAYVEERLNPDDTGLAALRTLWASYLSLFGESSDIFILTGIRNFIDASFYMDVEVQIGVPGEKPEPNDQRKPLQNMLDLIANIIERGVRDGTLAPTLESGKIARTALLIATAIVDNVARLPHKARDTRLIREELRDTFELLLRGLAADGCDKTLLTLPPE